MPPRKRADTADDPTTDTTPETDTPETEPEQADGPKRGRPPKPCTDCFPDGWPAGAAAVGCEHGSWQR